ncbi:hypothetical protein E7Z59_09965 [Robertkochia marina]|uniref:Uncharacterized protein n=1 Tax=Robertkochia marina TaxID=1227945 RepID=A0A4S3M0Q8_9FLAO|nr:hypothetical protein [Robertkochia marina]THD67964.1 hypothetical protein E7Z59_09965 [Robertkochia marina]TRZ41538.1 hypothetical protein D3A96_13145 [Robertkochia marina]
MDESKIIELLFYLLPAIITGLIAYYFFNLHTKNEDGRRRFLLHRENQKNALPLRLQAYERMALFLERINPSKLLIRIPPKTADKDSYLAALITTIENEFDHNISQQIYISDECWNVIKASKNATIQMIRKVAVESDTANSLRENVLNELLEKQAPSNAGLSFIKKEVGEMW